MNLDDLVRPGEVYARSPAERAGELLVRPFQLFVRRQVSGSVLLLACVVVALIWANSPWELAYDGMLHEPLGLTFGDYSLRFDLQHWINDGLMAVFFFAVGLEIKREFIGGELASVQRALFPVVAALGGMVVPALIYASLNHSGPGAHGWGIPMATDIVFALGALAILGRRIPEGLKVFLVALAIVDDIGALLVIAFFYTESINPSGLALAAVFLGGLTAANLAGARRTLVYLPLGAGLWYGLLISGVHATLAGVLSAMLVPATVRIVPEALANVVRRGASDIEARTVNGLNPATDPQRFGAISALQQTLTAASSPLLRFEHMVQPWVNFMILPVFALFNAGIVVDSGALEALSGAVPLGIIAGLAVGKPAGICLAVWLAMRAGIATPPRGVTWRHLVGTGFLAGIGFTMALFISGLAFEGSALENQAKMGILAGSGISAVIGIGILLGGRRAGG
jgi:NhaA family Na+:H+ antiporter